jgi:hypothetical protein
VLLALYFTERMTIMEPALSYKRLISLAAALFLLMAFWGCTDKPKDKPPAKAVAANEKNEATTPPPTQKTDATPPAKDANNENSDIQEKGNDQNARRRSDEEIMAENAARRKAALKEVIEKLGPPLVENAEKLIKIDPLYPVWIDKQNKRVVMEGVICQTGAPLEMFAVPTGTKEHEAIVAIPTEAHVVHAALIAVGAKPGKPVEFGPKPSDYKPATGTEIDITVKWKNDKGKIQTARAQEWIKNVKTGKEMQESWVFGGSGFWKDEQTGAEYYKAEGGDFICVSNFPSAMLDLPITSSQSNDELTFQANAERVPPRDTPVTVILTPKPANESRKNGLMGSQSLMMMVDRKQVIQENEEPRLGIKSE